MTRSTLARALTRLALLLVVAGFTLATSAQRAASIPDCVPSVVVLPEYPLSSWAEGEQGEVTAELAITSVGQVEKIKLLAGKPHLWEAVSSVLGQWRFHQCIGQPTTSRVIVFSFKIVDPDLHKEGATRTFIPPNRVEILEVDVDWPVTVTIDADTEIEVNPNVDPPSIPPH